MLIHQHDCSKTKTRNKRMEENKAKFIVGKFVFILLVSTTGAQLVFGVTKEGAKIELANINKVIICLMQSKIYMDKNFILVFS